MEERVKRVERRYLILTVGELLLLAVVLFGPQIKDSFVCIWLLFRANVAQVGNASEAITAIASLLTAVLAVFALFIARHHIQVHNRATALDTYREYLRLAIRYPEASRPDKQRKKIDVNDPGYDAFVTYLLFAAEEALTQFAKDENWRNALKLDLSHHKKFFESHAYKEDAASYTEELQRLVNEILSK